jgi:hypothetical protein
LPNNLIVIEVLGGVVSEVHNIPDGYRYEVVDWDYIKSAEGYPDGDPSEEALEVLPPGASKEMAEIRRNREHSADV